MRISALSFELTEKSRHLDGLLAGKNFFRRQVVV
jgi:hypothetical protein